MLAASVWAITAIGHRITGQLTVLRGAKVLFVVTVIGFAYETASLDKAKALALRILPKP